MATMTQTQWEYLVVPLPEAKGLKKADDPWEPDRLNALGAAGLGSDRSLAQVRRSHGLAGGIAQAPAGLRRVPGGRSRAERAPSAPNRAPKRRAGRARGQTWTGWRKAPELPVSGG